MYRAALEQRLQTMQTTLDLLVTTAPTGALTKSTFSLALTRKPDKEPAKEPTTPAAPMPTDAGTEPVDPLTLSALKRSVYEDDSDLDQDVEMLKKEGEYQCTSHYRHRRNLRTDTPTLTMP